MIRSILLASVLSASLSPLACTVYTLARSVDANVGLETARATLASNPNGTGNDAAQLAEEAALDGAEFAQR